jgi:hypothetical protein
VMGCGLPFMSIVYYDGRMLVCDASMTIAR